MAEQKKAKRKQSTRAVSSAHQKKTPVPQDDLLDAAVDKAIDQEALARGDMPMSLVDHLDELRRRAIVCITLIFIFALFSLIFSDRITQFITSPITQYGEQLNIFKLAGGFILRIKIAFFSSLVAGIPIILYEVWSFIMPAVNVEVRQPSRLSLIAATLLFYVGVAFVFFIALPFTLKLFLQFVGGQYIGRIGADDYLSFLFYFCIAIGLLFEFPIAVLLLTKTGIITPYTLKSKRKYSYLIIWVVAAIITPEDILSQIMVAIPLIILYEASIIISRLSLIRKKRQRLSSKSLDG